MNTLFRAPIFLYLILVLILGFVIGQSIDLGWGLPLGTSLTCFIAGLGLATTLHHSYAVRRHNRLLVKPHLIFDSQFNSTTLKGHHTYLLKVKNVGLGPAIIEKFSISFDGGGELDPYTMFEDLLELVNRETPTQGDSTCAARFLYSDHALDKGEEKIIIEVSIPEENRSFMQGREIARNLVNKIDASITYRCHYGSKETISKKNGLPNT